LKCTTDIRPYKLINISINNNVMKLKTESFNMFIARYVSNMSQIILKYVRPYRKRDAPTR